MWEVLFQSWHTLPAVMRSIVRWAQASRLDESDGPSQVCSNRIREYQGISVPKTSDGVSIRYENSAMNHDDVLQKDVYLFCRYSRPIVRTRGLKRLDVEILMSKMKDPGICTTFEHPPLCPF